MANTIITKNSSTANSVPSAASLSQGELAVNVTDQKLYSKDSAGSVFQIKPDKISQSYTNSTTLPGSSTPLYFCTGMGNTVKQARFHVATATTNGGPTSIGLALKALSGSSVYVYGYHARITSTAVSGANINYSSNLVTLIPPPTSYTTPVTWEVSLYRSPTSGTVQNHNYVVNYTASSTSSNYIITGTFNITCPFTGSQNYITDIGLYTSYSTGGTVSGATGFIENY